MHDTSGPPSGSGKEAYVEGLFSSIAPRYDLLNSVLSGGRHSAWRRLAVELSGLEPGGSAIDVCCGTGDFAFELARRVGRTGRVDGVDFSAPMVELARDKASCRGLEWVSFHEANACKLPFADGLFDCATVGFGLRNVADAGLALSEMARVVRPGGTVVCLEILGVRSGPLALPWRVYFRLMAPLSAVLFGSNRQAYEYLPRSVGNFMSPEELAGEFMACGLAEVEFRKLALGSVCIHIGRKPR